MIQLNKKKQLKVFKDISVIKSLYNSIFAVLNNSDKACIFGSMSFYLNNKEKNDMAIDNYFETMPDIDVYVTASTLVDIKTVLYNVCIAQKLKIMHKSDETSYNVSVNKCYVNNYHLVDFGLISDEKMNNIIKTSSLLKILRSHKFFGYENFFDNDYTVRVINNEQLLNNFIYALTDPTRVTNIFIERVKYLWNHEKDNIVSKLGGENCDTLPPPDGELSKSIHIITTKYKDDLVFGVKIGEESTLPRILICNKNAVYQMIENELILMNISFTKIDIQEQLLKNIMVVKSEVFIIYFDKCIQHTVSNNIKIASPILLSGIMLMFAYMEYYTLTNYTKCIIAHNYSKITKDDMLFLENEYSIIGTACVQNEYTDPTIITNKASKTIDMKWGLGIENEVMFYYKLIGIRPTINHDSPYNTTEVQQYKADTYDFYKYFKLIDLYNYLKANNYYVDPTLSVYSNLKTDVDLDKIVSEMSNTSSKHCSTHGKAHILDPQNESGEYCNLEIVTRKNANATIEDVVTELVTTRQKILKLLNNVEKSLSNQQIDISDYASYPYVLIDRPYDNAKFVYEKMSSYHFNITLPYGWETVPERNKIHKNFAIMVQLFEPYLASIFGTADYNAVNPENKDILLSFASFRLFNTPYAFIGTVDLSEDIMDIRTIPSGDTKKTNMMVKNISTKKIPYKEFQTRHMGTDFRRSNKDGYFGLELRFFDNFPTEYLYECLSLIFYLADLSVSADIESILDFVNSKSYVDSLFFILRCGSLHKPVIGGTGSFQNPNTNIDTIIYEIIKNFIGTQADELLNNFTDEINTYNSNKYSCLYDLMKIYYKYLVTIFGTSGTFSKYFITKIPKETLPCPNIDSILDACYSSSYILYKYLTTPTVNSEEVNFKYPFDIINNYLQNDIEKYQYIDIGVFDNNYVVHDIYSALENFVRERNYHRHYEFTNESNRIFYLPYNLIVFPTSKNIGTYNKQTILADSHIQKYTEKMKSKNIPNFGILIYNDSEKSAIICEIRNMNVDKFKLMKFTSQ